MEGCRKVGAVVILVAVVLLVRRPGAILKPQFYAEDATVFFAQQRDLGARAVFQPSAGYLHLVPRLIALSAFICLPASAAPICYNYTALLIILATASYLFSPRFNVAHKPLLALAIVLIPNTTNDVLLLTPTNLQWLTVTPLLLVVLFKEAPHKKFGSLMAQWVSDLTTIVLCGLTGPFVIVFLPFFAWRALKERTRYRLAMFLAVLAGVVVQSYHLVAADALRWEQPMSCTGCPVDLVARRPLTGHDYCQLFGGRILADLFVGATVNAEVDHFTQFWSCPRGSFCYLCGGFYVVLVGFLLWLSWHNRFAMVCLVLHFLFIACALKREVGSAWLLSPYWDGRYFFVPHLMLAWCIISVLDQQQKWKKNVLRILLGMILFSLLTTLSRVF